MTTDPEATTIETLQDVNSGDILEVLPTRDDAPHEPQYIRVSRAGDTGIIGEYMDITTGEVANTDVLAVLLAPHGLYGGYRKTVYLGEISHEGTLPKGTYKETIPVYATLAKEGDESPKLTSTYREELREFNADSNTVPLSENAQLLSFMGDRLEFKIGGQEDTTYTYRVYRKMRLFDEQGKHVGHLRHVMRRNECETCNLLLDAIDNAPTDQHLVEEWQAHHAECGGYVTHSVVEYVNEAHVVVGEVIDLKVNWDDLHQGTLAAQ